MLDKEAVKKRRDAKCRHFNGMMNKLCNSKIPYPESSADLPCYGERECEGYLPLTEQELADKERELERHIYLMRKGLSSCCEAPFDKSQVITSGQHANHGPRLCSKCGKLCFMV